MKWRRVASLFCALCVLLCPVVAADGNTILYDDGNGESLQELLGGSDEAWPTIALPAEGELTVKAKGAVLMDLAVGRCCMSRTATPACPLPR